MDKVILNGENGEEIALYILESTQLAGKEYILASDVQTGDGDCYILKDVSEGDSDEAIYEMVEDEHELVYLLNIFSELVEDVDFEY